MWKNLTKVLPLAFHEKSMLPCGISLLNKLQLANKIIIVKKTNPIMATVVEVLHLKQKKTLKTFMTYFYRL